MLLSSYSFWWFYKAGLNTYTTTFTNILITMTHPDTKHSSNFCSHSNPAYRGDTIPSPTTTAAVFSHAIGYTAGIVREAKQCKTTCKKVLQNV